MASTKLSSTLIIELTLTREEALWIKHISQNPIIVNDFDSEDFEEANIRKSIFESLPTFMELS